MRIGIDFDNTIVCYDRCFENYCNLEPQFPFGIEKNKKTLKSYLEKMGWQDKWTKIQGEVYGPGMRFATLYPEFIEFLVYALSCNHQIKIMSHRTRYPYLGEKYDLHRYAREWIDEKILPGVDLDKFNQSDIYFYEDKSEKIKKISEWSPDLFIDDLPEILMGIDLKISAQKILFGNPNDLRDFNFLAMNTWRDVLNHLVTFDIQK